ncbi:MAG TPA: hypothetical protein VFW34_03550 [Candidatus Rubrimentiphilum sp.]|nr:hypothetical protein [Candidatus Rubrimentiphilum sp.]
MIGRLFLAGITAAVLASGAATAHAQTAASPLVALQLRGHWTCTQAGGTGGTYSQDWTAPFGGLWLRATDSVKGQVTAEHTITFNKADNTWVVLDAFLAGNYDVLHGTESGSNHIAFHAVYPKLALAVVYNRLTPVKYTLDVTGNLQGKKLLTHSVCVKP